MANGYNSFAALQSINECISKSLHDPISISSPLHPNIISGLPCNVLDFTTKTQLHVVMVPYPVQGQINPMMQFAKLLTANPDVDIMVTMVHNKHNHDCIQQTARSAVTSSTDVNTSMHSSTYASPYSPASLQAHPHMQNKLYFTWVENGLPPDFDYSAITKTTAQGMEFHQATLRMKDPLKKLLQSFNNKSPPVSCVLFGTFCGWAHSAAAELGIPTLMFWSQSAAMFSIYHHMPLLITNGFFPYSAKKHLPGCHVEEGAELAADLVTYIPGLPPLHPSSFPTLLHVDNFSDDPSIAIIKEQFSIIVGRSCDGVIINSFEELEKDTCQALRQELPNFGISLVGPLLPSAFLDGNNANDTTVGASLLPEESECIKWLDGKQKHSVLYISFGSLFSPSADELEDIALGIKSCKQPYLWVIRPNASFQDVSDILPKDFVEDTKDYGLIITWAPQVQVLSHPSVGAFLTHCGWNSALESLSMGMPMISFPIFVDQTTNSTFVCDIWKVGMALKRQDNGKLKSADVEMVVRTVLHEEEGLKMRERAGKLRDAARQAVQAVQGSSYAHIDKFIQGLTNHARPKPAVERK